MLVLDILDDKCINNSIQFIPSLIHNRNQKIWPQNVLGHIYTPLEKSNIILLTTCSASPCIPLSVFWFHYTYICVCVIMQLYIYIRTSLQVSSTNLLICYWYIYHRCIPVLYPSPSMKSIWIVRFPYEPFTVLGPSAFLCNASAQDWQKDMRHLAARSLEDAWSCLEDGNVQQCQQDLGVQWSDDLMHLDHFGRTKNVRIIKDYQSNQIRKNLTQNAKWNHTSHHRNWKQRDFVSLMKRLEKNQRS
jgi:hypothetical protein